MRSFSIKGFSARGLAAFDLRRLAGPLVVAACLVGLLAASHYALGFALGEDAAAIHPRQRPIGAAMYDRVWGRVSAVDRLYKGGQLPSDTDLGIYFGVSTSATGIQRRFLEDNSSLVDRWIVLTGAGLSFENIESVMLPVYYCSLRPKVVVFGIHPQMLVGERYIEDRAANESQPVVGRRRRALETKFVAYRALGWLREHFSVRHRAVVAEYIRSQVYALRLWVFRLARVSASGLFPPAPEPWDENPYFLWNMDDAQNEFANNQVEFWTRQGHFDAANYHLDGSQAKSIVRMIRNYRALGADVYLVLMPLRSTLRKIVPPVAKPSLMKVLDEAFPKDPPVVIDLETAMPDRFFTDEAHLSEFGAQQLSTLVARRLQAEAEARKPREE